MSAQISPKYYSLYLKDTNLSFEDTTYLLLKTIEKFHFLLFLDMQDIAIHKIFISPDTSIYPRISQQVWRDQKNMNALWILIQVWWFNCFSVSKKNSQTFHALGHGSKLP